MPSSPRRRRRRPARCRRPVPPSQALPPRAGRALAPVPAVAPVPPPAPAAAGGPLAPVVLVARLHVVRARRVLIGIVGAGGGVVGGVLPVRVALITVTAVPARRATCPLRAGVVAA